LQGITLIDMPGIDSPYDAAGARAAAQFDEVDAVIYASRRLQEADLAQLQSLGGDDRPIGAAATLTVLTRADETGAGRIDALLAARDIARRHRNDPAIRSRTMDVIPVAGLVAQTAARMRRLELEDLSRIAGLDRTSREQL